MMALLSSELVPQNIECETGPLWQNCDGPVLPRDHETQQIFEDAEHSYQLKSGDAAVIFYFQQVSYRGSASKLEGVDIVLIIDIVANAAGSEKRQEIIDEIEERFWYRVYSYTIFQDANEPDKYYVPFMRWMNNNQLQATTQDDSNFQGRYTIRTIRLSLSTNECVEKPPCDDEAICFDFGPPPDFGNVC